MSKKWKSIPSVTNLKRVGVKFEVGSANGSIMDIKFNNGVMKIPGINIEDHTEALFRNCIAFEQYCGGNVTYMTYYAHLMDCLINSGEDVKDHSKKGILTNWLGHEEVVAALFNNLCSEVVVANFYYSDLCNQVNVYYNTRRHLWRATLKHDCFNSPWSIASVVVGIMFLFLGITGTVFAILSFFTHKS